MVIGAAERLGWLIRVVCQHVGFQLAADRFDRFGELQEFPGEIDLSHLLQHVGCIGGSSTAFAVGHTNRA